MVHVAEVGQLVKQNRQLGAFADEVLLGVAFGGMLPYPQPNCGEIAILTVHMLRSSSCHARFPLLAMLLQEEVIPDVEVLAQLGGNRGVQVFKDFRDPTAILQQHLLAFLTEHTSIGECHWQRRWQRLQSGRIILNFCLDFGLCFGFRLRLGLARLPRRCRRCTRRRCSTARPWCPERPRHVRLRIGLRVRRIRLCVGLCIQLRIQLRARLRVRLVRLGLWLQLPDARPLSLACLLWLVLREDLGLVAAAAAWRG
mmetsp:Transcript_79341/g.190436  ORF Transcript_79341/g.190436 Transcript_79341/m.190436 type:complete len:255 (+) Transcript_79341:361-1125(+)